MRQLLGWIIVMGLGLSGCQMTATPGRTADKGRAQLSCRANLGCQIMRIDQKISSQSVPAPGEMAPVLTMPAGRHEVAIEFYPVSTQRAEHFSFIHDFARDRRYVLAVYRQRSGQDESLSQVTLPRRMCIDLIEGETPIRRFCRQSQDPTATNEFVELKLVTR